TEYFVQPRVMSENVDLHPLLVIFSLLAGSALFGLPGLLLGIPVAAIGKGLFVNYFEKYTDSKLTTEGGALFRSRPDGDEDDTDIADADETVPEESNT
ncbi:MAG: AI-2E family transporter, partial [Coriobacteriia bacterium]